MDKSLLNEFLIESFENVSEIDLKLTSIEQNPEDKELLNSLYRIVHTMKGSASFLGLTKLQEVTHVGENLLDQMRSDKINVSSQVVDVLLLTFDHCKSLLKNLESNGEEGDLDGSEVISKINAILEADNSNEESSEDIKEDLESLNDLEDVEENITKSQEQSLSQSDVEIIDAADLEDDELESLIDQHIKESPKSSKVKEFQESQAADSEVSEEKEVKINDAAMDSLKELMDTGSIDASIMEELQPISKKESKPEFSKEEKVAQEEEKKEEINSLDKQLEELMAGEEINIDEDIKKAQKKKEENQLKVVEPKVEEVKATEKAEAAPNKPGLKIRPAIPSKIVVSEEYQDENNVTQIKPKPEESQKQAAPAAQNKLNLSDSIVRVNVKVLDKIMNIVGELVLNRNQILQSSESFKSNGAMVKLTQQLIVITSDLQREVMTTRMQPIGSVLTKFERLVRDFSRENNKKIKLKLTGQETELDKTLIEAIKDPLVHIVRNAIDHGMESINERKEAGKSELGTLNIKAYNEGGLVTIEVSDDGRGINTARVLEKAIEKGLVTSEEASRLSDNQIHQFIFHSGFSTAEAVTNISGRGVGMDVVRTNIEAINGVINIESEAGIGTTFKIKIPLTLAIVPALIVRSKNEYFAIPQLNLVELVRIDENSKEQVIEKIQDYEFLKLRGSLNPLVRLKSIINQEADIAKESEGKHEDHVENVVILNSEDINFGIVVDEILDTVEIVVKPLSQQLKNLSIYGGATIMGNGHVALILDVSGILQKFLNKVEQEQTRNNHEEVSTETFFTDDYHESIVFRLFNGRDFAIPLTLVHRLEEFEFGNVELVGDNRIIRYLDRSMPLLEIEKFLGLSTKDYLSELKPDDKIQCIVIKNKNNLYGFLVDKIIDIDKSNSKIETDLIKHNGLMGVYYNGQNTINVLDVYSIINSFDGVVDIDTTKDKEKFKKSQLDVLIVDDSMMYRKLVSSLFEELGFNITTAINGKDGFDKLQDHQFDLVVTDIEMPICNGFQLSTKIRELEQYNHVPILAMSTKYTEEFLVKGKKAGITSYIEKFEKAEFIEEVNNLLRVA